MFKISSGLSPIRLIEKQETPVVITICLKNETDKSKLVSLIVKIPFSLGFNKIGLERETRRRIGFIKAGEEKTVPIMIYPKSTIIEGIYPIDARIKIHEERYDKVEKEYNLRTELRVIGK